MPVQTTKSTIKWVILVVAIIAFALAIRNILRRQKAPGQLAYISPGAVGSFDPTAINNAIHQDQGRWGYINEDVYTPILRLTDNQLIALVNDWNRRFYAKHQKTLRQIVNEQPWGFFGYSPTRDAIDAKFQNLLIQ